ncbi:hypothetical protein NB717_000195 [Xanthomonas sacchari]|uniref:protein kinase domain-containing protein n=1 Tax=Xanthomonas sacchari TaxID=56458 RepID=UPI00225E1B36|nr:hypothetical protein [Xanthomonas sacchari]MCW0459127.1 hypothetical protein [Xanthomonas sacchari]
MKEAVKKTLEFLDLWCIEGRYEPLERVGNGHGGLCFKGIDKIAGNHVFIKILVAPRGDIELSKFRMEHTVLELVSTDTRAKLCPKPLAFVERDDQFAAALVTEWVEGRTLEKAYKEFQCRPIQDKLELLRRINLVFVLASTFTQHRDLHPGNIIIMQDDLVKLFPPHKFGEMEAGVRLIDWGESLPHLFANYDESPDDHFTLAERVPKTLTGTFDGLPPETFTKEQDIRTSGIGGKAISWSFGLITTRLLLDISPEKFKSVAGFISAIQSGLLQRWINEVAKGALQLDTANSHIISAMIRGLLTIEPSKRLDIGDAGTILRDLLHEDLSFINSAASVAGYLSRPIDYGGWERWNYKDPPEYDG